MVLKPIFSAIAKDSSVVPVFEHSSLNFLNPGSFSKNFAIGWSGERAKKENPNKVSGLVVKHFISSTGKSPSILKLSSQPKDLPIQFCCITFTLFGQFFNLSSPSNRSFENFEMLKNH